MRKAPVPVKKTEKRSRSRVRNLIDDLTAILLISTDAKGLCDFYRATLGFPLKEERHNDIHVHYGFSLGDVHFAIHDAEGRSGGRTRNIRSPVITFSTSNVRALTERLSAKGVKFTGPTDHGFGHVVSFHDPDGNAVSVVEYAPEYW
ncbi:MAG: VOC family protein [Acidobacteria bacterium]|nr:VOC family protein [Acidobacteriota bacterium]